MATITITGDSPEDLKTTFKSLFGLDPPVEKPPGNVVTVTAAAPAGQAAAEPAKGKGSRKRAEAPAPLQPENVSQSQPPAPAPLAQPPAPSPTPFVPHSPIPVFNPAGNGAIPPQTQDRPAVAKLRNHLQKLVTEHGEPQIYNWLTKAFGLSPTVTVNEFMASIIQQQRDSDLEDAYRLSGGE